VDRNNKNQKESLFGDTYYVKVSSRMKITVRQLRRVIAEEVERVLSEGQGNKLEPSELVHYKWVLDDGSVEGTFDLNDARNRDYASGAKKIGDGTNKKVTLVPKYRPIEFRPIEFASVNVDNTPYFVGDTDGLVKYFNFKMKM
jgi:hypothetical protein